MLVPVEIVGKRKDFVGRNILTNKIIFVRDGREDTRIKISHYAVIRIHKEYERYSIGTPVLYGAYDEIHGELKDLLTRTLKDLSANRCELVPVVHSVGRKVETLGLGIYYERHCFGDVYLHYIDAVDFAQKADKIKPIIEYNEKIREINKKIEETIKSLDKNPSTALLPEDWDFEKSEWKESGKKKIQERKEIVFSIVSNLPPKPEPDSVELRRWLFVSSGVFVKDVYSDTICISSYTTLPRVHVHEYLSKHFTNIDEILEKHGKKIMGGYIIKYFPIPIYSRVWDDSYGKLITGGIYGGCWRGEDYLYFMETTAYGKKAYVVYPAIIAESKEEAMKRAEKIADGDGTVEGVAVEKISEGVWIIKWSVFD